MLSRLLLTALAALGLSSLARAADEPVALDILRSGAFVMNGIVYEIRAELAAAVRELKPKAIRIRPAVDANYDRVAEALRALQDSGVPIDIGFRGNMKEE